jgi:hypothetical protein
MHSRQAMTALTVAYRTSESVGSAGNTCYSARDARQRAHADLSIERGAEKQRRETHCWKDVGGCKLGLTLYFRCWSLTYRQKTDFRNVFC